MEYSLNVDDWRLFVFNLFVAYARPQLACAYRDERIAGAVSEQLVCVRRYFRFRIVHYRSVDGQAH